MFLDANIKTMDPDFGLSCWGWIYFLFYANFCRMSKETGWRTALFQGWYSWSRLAMWTGPVILPERLSSLTSQPGPNRVLCVVPGKLIPSPILQPFCSSLTSNTHCMTPSRDSEILPVLVLLHNPSQNGEISVPCVCPLSWWWTQLLLGTPMPFCAHSMAGC